MSGQVQVRGLTVQSVAVVGSDPQTVTVSNMPPAAALINDGVTSTTQVWSSSKTSTEIAALSATYAPMRPRTVVLFGDSRVANCDYADATDAFSTNRDWLGWGNYQTGTGPALDMIHNGGVGGNTTAQMLARVGTDVLAYNPGYLILWGGTNDTWATTTDVDATFGRMVQIMQAATGAGIYIFLVSETTSSAKGTTFPTLVQYYNERLLHYAAGQRDVEFWDFNSLVINPADPTGMPKAAMLASDGVHPSPYGAAVLGQKIVAPALSRFKTSLASLVNTPIDTLGNNANVRNIVSNPLMTATGGTVGAGDSGTVPGSWASSAGGGTVTAVCSTPARSDGFGNDFQMAITATASGSKYGTQAVNTARLVQGGQYIIEAAAGLDSPVSVVVFAVFLQIFTSGGGGTWMLGAGQNSVAFESADNLLAASNFTIRSRKFTIPTGVTISGANLQWRIAFANASGGSCTARLGRVSLKRVDNL